ncbi:MAG: hypothetical protein Q9228_000816 [Teloschistes exilis]
MRQFSLAAAALASLLLLLPLTQAKHVKQTLTITWSPGSPNGATRNIIKTNGQFPAPALTFDENDDVEITVHNKMPFNTTVHWHGLEMNGTPWADGVPGVSQKPIDPGQTYVYRFKAYPAGTYWYHSHSRATLLDGLYGALFINPKRGSPAPWSLISSDQGDIRAMSRAAANPELIVVSDWSSFTSEEWLAAQEASHLDLFCGDSILVNGKGNVYCPGQPFLINQTNPFIQEALNSLSPTTPGPQTNQTVVNDKGCFPFVQATQGIFLKDKDVSKIPPGLWSGCKPSTGSTEVITVNPDDKWASLNWVMAATFREIIFGIDEHDMWIYEIDGKYIEPQRVQTVTMIPGERYSVMVKLDKKPGDYGIAVNDNGISQIIQGKAVLHYRGGKSLGRPTVPWITYGGQNNPNLTKTPVGVNDASTPPYPPIAPAPTSDAMYVLDVGRWTTAWQWTLTGKAIMAADANAYQPLLYNKDGPAANDPNLVIRTKNGSWVDLILVAGAIKDEPIEISHALHKHASKTWLIGSGEGAWNYTSTAEAIKAQPQSFNLKNPNYRDTFITSFGGLSWIALRYQVTNPGAWLFHCHVETHLAGGMGMVIMDGVDKWPTLPPQGQ